jgi:RHS repeat-associated protein
MQPWLQRVSFYKAGSTYDDGISYSEEGNPKTCGAPNGRFHGLLLRKMIGHHRGKTYDYDFSAYPSIIDCNQDSWSNHITPLKTATDWDHTIVHRFEYGSIVEDTYDSPWGGGFHIFHSPKLLRHTTGSTTGNGLTLEVPTETEYLTYVKPGTPDQRNRQAIHGWVTAVKNGIGHTALFNGSFNVVEHRMWYTDGRCDPGAGQTCPSYDLHGDPGACTDWDAEPDLLAYGPCHGRSWVWTYTTNVDGAVTSSTSPDGTGSFHDHILDWALWLPGLSIGPDGSVHDQMLAFWSDYWHLRWWTANEVRTEVRGGELFRTQRTTFEPLYNQPLEHRLYDIVTGRLNYDYLYQNQDPDGLEPEEMLARMGMSHKSEPMWFPSNQCPFLPGVPLANCPHRIFHGLPWGDCENGTNPAASPEEEGNLVCETKPESAKYELVGQRDAVSATYTYDEWGRQTWIHGYDGETTEVEWTNFEDAASGMLRMKIVTRDPGGSDIRTGYLYDERGRNTWKVLPVGDEWEQVVVTGFWYDQLGRVTKTEQRLTVMSDLGGGTVEKREAYAYDTRGNLISAATERNPGNGPLLVLASNDAGDTLRHLKVHDGKNRVQMDCREEYQRGDTEYFVCTVNQYGLDDRLLRQGRFSGCAMNESAGDTTLLRGGDCLPAGWGGFDYVVEHAYDQRRLRHATTTGRWSDDERTSLTMYDPVGRVRGVRDAADSDGLNGPEWTVSEYDDLGRLARTSSGVADPFHVHDEGVMATAFEYDDFDNVVRETRGAPYLNETDLSAGHVFRHYDVRGSLLAERVYQYPVGQPGTSAAQVTYYDRDQAERVATERVRYPSGAVVERRNFHDVVGRLELVEDDFSNTETFYVNDWLGRVASRTTRHVRTNTSLAPEDLETESVFVHNGSGEVVWRIELGDGDEFRGTYYLYDGYGYPVGSMAHSGQWTYHLLDGLGRELVQYELEADGRYSNGGPWVVYDRIETYTAWDSAGNVIARADSGKNGVEAGLPIGDPLFGNGITWFDRNDHGEIIEVDQPSAPTGQSGTQRYRKQFTLNGEGAITGIDHWQGDILLKSFDMDLDRFNRPVSVDSPGGAERTLAYDIAGNIHRAQDNNHGLDETHRVTTRRAFDTFGNLLRDRTEIESDGGTKEFQSRAWFDGGRMQRLQTPLGAETTLGYQSGKGLLGGVVARKIPGNLSISYPAAAYEWMGSRPLGRQVRSPDLLWGSRSRTGWDGFGDLVEYDERAFLLGGLLTSQVTRFEYDYNDHGRLIAEQKTGGSVGESRSYTLDDLDRVVGYQSDSHPPKRFFLDEVNNIRQTAWGSVWWDVVLEQDRTVDEGASDGLNTVTRIEYPAESMTRELTHDASGNTLTDSGAPGGLAREFDWDDHGRLVAVETGQAGEAGWKLGRYVYDAFDRRVARYTHSDPAAPERADLTEFHLYGSDVVEEVEDYFQPSKLDRAFVVFHDPTAVDRYLMFQTYERVGGSWKYRYSTLPVTDRRNNVVGLLRNGSVPASTRRTYDLHGYEESPDSGSFYMPYRFAGRQWDAESDLYYYRSRYYDPSLGRFISVDTIGIWGDLNNYGNGYAYVGNMGNSGLDPSGNSVWVTRENNEVTIHVALDAKNDVFSVGDFEVTERAAEQFLKGELGKHKIGVDIHIGSGDPHHKLVIDPGSAAKQPRQAGNYNSRNKTITIRLKDGQVGPATAAYVLAHEILAHLLGAGHTNDSSHVAHGTFKNAPPQNIFELLFQLLKKIFANCEGGTCHDTELPKDPPEAEDGDGSCEPPDGTNEQMTAPDSRGVPNIREMLASGRLKSPPNERERIREYSYERLPLQAQFKWREQRKRPSIDGRRPALFWWKFQAPVVNWDNRMGLLPGNRSGVIDPVR